jgi:hypothetical protein
MNWLALDIGGANLKVADGLEYCRSYALPLWRERERLSPLLREAMAVAPPSERLAVTMTGELADCFASKAEGVRFIVEAAVAAADRRTVLVYLINGRLAEPQEAAAIPLQAAASNWHVLACFAGRFAPRGAALVLDAGSTTCDVIPLVAGRPAARGSTDTERLLSGELLYTGVERTPICGVKHVLPYRGRQCPVASELFATTRDAYVLLGRLPEDASCIDTADGRPLTKAACQARLGRMVCADEAEFNESDALVAAQAVADTQANQLAGAIAAVRNRLPARPAKIIVSGHGDFLADAALALAGEHAPVVRLSDELGPACSRCAPAHALAVLAREAVVS